MSSRAMSSRMRTFVRALGPLLVLVALAAPVRALAGDQVPLQGSDSGTWGQGSHACGQLFPVFVVTSGTASHLGRYAYESQECVDFATAEYAGTFEITAADGASVHGTYAGTFAVVDGVIRYEQENVITGGSRRLAGASGSFHVSGLASTDDFSDTQRLDGAVSTIGSNK